MNALRYDLLLSLATPAVLFLALSCERHLAVAPPNDRLETHSVFADSQSAALAISGIYSDLTVGQIGPVASQNRLGGLYADELDYSGTSAILLQFHGNAVQADNSELASLWRTTYRHIYQANAIIEGVEASAGIPPSAKAALMAEARFIRAFVYVYAVNNWGDIPLILGTDYRTNEKAPRSDAAEIYGQIESDLGYAREHLPSDYPTPERLRPTRFAATALLARVHLYRQAWDKAASLASELIARTDHFGLSPLVSVFGKESRETIWQLYLASTVTTRWTLDGFNFVPASLTNSSIPLYLISETLLAAFEANDGRRAHWIGEKTAGPYHFPYKYKIRQGPIGVAPTEYTVVFRLAEQYLIRAEARARLGDAAGALNDLNVVRMRADLTGLPANLLPDAVIDRIEQERRIELFCEWGHRWLDLKRSGNAEAALSAKPGVAWHDGMLRWPIPLDQLLANPFLTQNESY